MKKHIITLMVGAMLALTASKTDAQMTLQQTFTNGSNMDFVVPSNCVNGPLQVVDLLLDGKKYALQNMLGNQVLLYNLDFSLWKTINIPIITGHTPITAYYISENLFKIDGYVDMVVDYSTTSSSVYTQLVIDQTGAIINTIDSSTMIEIYSTGTDTFVAVTVNENYSGEYITGNVGVYSLPGTIPCNACSSGLGIARIANGNSDGSLSDAIPNPTTGDTKISYSLPIGINNGTIALNNQTGQKVQSYKVTNNIPYIIISTTSLTPGVYYYTLSAISMNPITKKLVVN